MKPLVEFGDAEAAMIRHISAGWATRVEAYRPATFTNAFPVAALRGAVTHVQVELDGTPIVEYPATERASVRFTCWAAPGQPSHAKRVAALTQAMVATHPGDADVWGTRILAGRLRGRDPATGNEFVFFTARINLRPSAL